MSSFKLLIDTNVVIGLEDARPVQSSLAELLRLSAEHNVGVFVHGANYDDVSRDRDVARRAVTLSKLAKFQQLRGLPSLSDADRFARFGRIQNENDRSDVGLLEALDAKAVDFVISQDNGLLRRAERFGFGSNVLTVEDALDWLRQTFQSKAIGLPHIVDKKAYEISLDDPIFESLRADYAGFDGWFDKCRKQHRDCWVLQVGKVLAGLIVRKNENASEAGIRHQGPKILKICTMKVRDEFRGEKFGELLLKQILWFAQSNNYDAVYLTVFDKQAFLIDLLEFYGFEATMVNALGERVMEKSLARGPLSPVATDIFLADRLVYPRFHDGASVRKYVVPIRADYHRLLFPEIASHRELPLFPRDEFGSLSAPSAGERKPGNTIRKVYLCRAQTKSISPGDVLFFYLSKDDLWEGSQSITTIGVAESVKDVSSTGDLIRWTAKRFVFSAEELEAMAASPERPVKMIDFLLIGHLKPAIALSTLLRLNVFATQPPQSIARIDDQRYESLRPLVSVGFEI